MRMLLSLMIILALTACQQNPPQVPPPFPEMGQPGGQRGGAVVDAASDVLPTLVPFPTLPESVTVIPAATRRLQAIPTRDRPASLTPLPTWTASLSPAGTAPLTPTLPPLTLPTATVSAWHTTEVFGQSGFGRSLIAHRLGTGAQTLMLVGGIHGGWEANTVELLEALIAHYEAAPDEVLPGLSLVIIPALNPDGLDRGRVLEGRFNQNLVDLNRNWGCEWAATAYFQNRVVSAGDAPFSEPESQALSAYILQLRPAAVLFYHSAADGIFIGDCAGETAGSETLAQVLGDATGYSYGAGFSAYPVTGTAPTWVVAQGIPSADVELAVWQDPEVERNLRGVLALQCWLVGEGLPRCRAA